MSCSPPYRYRPTFTPSNIKCIAPSFVEHRSRLTVEQMFFRSKDQGTETNLLELEIDSSNLYVYFEGVLVETFPATLGFGGIAALRATISNPITGSDYIEMPVLGFDIFDLRSQEDDDAVDPPLDIIAGGLTSFSRRFLRGGSGAPIDDAGLTAIRTGPERSIIILASTENSNGRPITPPWFRRVQQWTGSAWVTYANLVANACPYVGVSE